MNQGKTLFNINNLNIETNSQLIGENGCGKSTFMKVIATHLISQGQYEINDVNLANYNIDSIRKNILYASNKSFLPNLSILRYITNNEKDKIDELHIKFNKYKLQNIFNDFGIKLEDIILNNGNNFSSGQKQLIVLLPLLINNYSLILLDEIFDNIDEINFQKLQKLITKIHHDKLFIEISHNNKYLYKNGGIDFAKFNNNKVINLSTTLFYFY